MGTNDETLGRVREQRERLEAAAVDLEVAITRAAGDTEAWTTAVQVAADEVGAALQGHVDEVEAPQGLYVEILERSPRLGHTIDVLRREHETMGSQVAQLDAVLADRRSTPDDIRDQALTLLGQISRHRHRGADLIWDSFDYDIGAGD